ncbi:IS1096 element passenger TnpR family protein [Pontimicrobium aquaticum]|uniref:Plasmid pRiA4b ORF-3 family protein n=1 Tax=Pontimicrobium aquaticum TaxID=2565367 RepID=A0A4U0EMQ4_9FLAO|nr:plasmid pRiA4b ORF-3 family protein [Pontimicrobium aquaticum]TJY32855.1 plasmid pRiA4b ORF-3 family protein [Pontimicrobium aquaticum]
MIYRFRVLLDNDTEDDIFRDIEIRKTDTLEDLHNTITQSFGFDGTEMASFYRSDDEWNQGEEISLFDMSEGTNSVKLMNETLLEDIVNKDNTKLIYVYDFFSMWTFLVELGEIVEVAEGVDYPNLMYVHGQIPTEAPEKSFEVDDSDNFDEFGNDLNVDDYEDLDFNENWN